MSARKHIGRRLASMYEVDGKMVNKDELMDLIMKELENGKGSVPELAERMNTTYRAIKNCVKTLRELNYITNTGEIRDGNTLYRSSDFSFLDAIFMKNKEDVEKSFKVKSVTVREVNDAPNIRSGYGGSDVTYGDSYYGSEHWEKG